MKNEDGVYLERVPYREEQTDQKVKKGSLYKFGKVCKYRLVLLFITKEKFFMHYP